MGLRISMKRKGKANARMWATQDFIKGFEKVNDRKPTNEEGLVFATGFNVGWKMRGKLKYFDDKIV